MREMTTYCNPLAVEDIPSGRPLNARVAGIKDVSLLKDHRSISDPSVIFWDGKWIMYPSYGIAYVSEDFVHWKHADVGIPDLTYSPAIVEWRGKWYAAGHMDPDVYVADSPLGPFVKCGDLTDINGNVRSAVDGCFLADGDHLYLFWHSQVPNPYDEDVEFMAGSVGVELDPDEPWKMLCEPVVINRFDPKVSWQRLGEYNQNERVGWIEGQWAFKLGGRYYLMYSGCGTEFGAYANGVVYSDEGPLKGYVPQKNHSPLTEKRTGLLRGAGHGSIAPGPNGSLWVFYTYALAYDHMYERLVGMDPIGVDENGELFCPATTETPQYAPGVKEHPENGNDAGLLPLTVMQRAYASSCAPGRSAIYAVDESLLSWWQPEDGDEEKTLTVPLGDATGYNVNSVRLIWRYVGMESLDGIVTGPIRYTVEYKAAACGEDWRMLVDASGNDRDLWVDYRQFEPVKAYALRLKITGAPNGISPGVINFSAFGKCAHEK